MTESNFYNNAASYWASVPATLDGVLGGYAHISDLDINGSKAFLEDILANDNIKPDTSTALDCGAGIGRISKNILINYFKTVDLVDQDAKFINAAEQLIGKDNSKLGTLYKIGLQHFKPEKKYDVIWCQWVLGHLKDYDLIDFLERCRDALNVNGMIVVKENITSSDEIEYDEVDSSVTRPYLLLSKIFEEANLKVVREMIQEGLPDDLYPIYMFALKKNTSSFKVPSDSSLSSAY